MSSWAGLSASFRRKFGTILLIAVLCHCIGCGKSHAKEPCMIRPQYLPSDAYFDDPAEKLDHGEAPRVAQRVHETRKAAVRALIMYPMNALVEDQMTRLRKALDSQSAHDWLDRNCNRNRIYLGRYNGGTPVPGHEWLQNGSPNERKNTDLLNELQKADEAARVVDQHIRDNQGNERVQDARYFFPRLNGAEMRCRWDMQDAPPDSRIFYANAQGQARRVLELLYCEETNASVKHCAENKSNPDSGILDRKNSACCVL
jgi:ATP-dependent helicase YprA (DUF1998 family)